MRTLYARHWEPFLKRHGWEFLGKGFYSQVYGKGPLALKLCETGDGWADYVKWATTNGWAGGYAPKVYAIHHYAGSAYVALMERLDWRYLDTIGTDRYAEHRDAVATIRNAVDTGSGAGSASPEQCFGTMLRYAFKHAGQRWDCHEGNFMGKGTRLVLTDPISELLTSSPDRRWKARHTLATLPR